MFNGEISTCSIDHNLILLNDTTLSHFCQKMEFELAQTHYASQLILPQKLKIVVSI